MHLITTRIQRPSYICSSVTMFISHYVHQSLCSSVTMFISHCVHQSLCSSVTMFISHYVHQSLCSSVTVFISHYVHQSLCSSVTMFISHYARIQIAVKLTYSFISRNFFENCLALKVLTSYTTSGRSLMTLILFLQTNIMKGTRLVITRWGDFHPHCIRTKELD